MVKSTTHPSRNHDVVHENVTSEVRYSTVTAKPSWIPTEMYPYLPGPLAPQTVISNIPLAHAHEQPPRYIPPMGHSTNAYPNQFYHGNSFHNNQTNSVIHGSPGHTGYNGSPGHTGYNVSAGHTGYPGHFNPTSYKPNSEVRTRVISKTDNATIVSRNVQNNTSSISSTYSSTSTEEEIKTISTKLTSSNKDRLSTSKSKSSKHIVVDRSASLSHSQSHSAIQSRSGSSAFIGRRGPGFTPADGDQESEWGSIPAREKYFNQRRGSHDLFADWKNPHSHGLKVIIKKDRKCC